MTGTDTDADVDLDLDMDLYGPELLKALKHEHHIKKRQEIMGLHDQSVEFCPCIESCESVEIDRHAQP